MATVQDDIIGIGEESVWGTPVAVDRWYPHLDDDDSQWDARTRQGKGLHGGAGRTAYFGSRNFATAGQGTVKLKAEIESKQAGELFRAGIGTSNVAAVSGTPGGSFQLFHPGISGVYLPIYTIQHIKVRNDGTEYVETYGGCTARKTTIEQPEDDIATIEVEFDALEMTTGTAAGTESYATSTVLYDAYNVTTVGLEAWASSGYTVPTTTAIGTGVTASTEFREFKIEIDHQIDDKDWKLGPERGRPIAGMPKITFSGKADFDGATLADGIKAGTKMIFECTWGTGVTNELDTGVSGALQVYIPQMVLMKEMPKVKAGERRTIGVSADVTNDGTNRDMYVCYRTVDTVL